MNAWTIAAASRLLDELGSGGSLDLPLFRGLEGAGRTETVRVERADEATLAFWEGLLRAAGARCGTGCAEVRRGRRLLALAVPDGPALLAIRPDGRSAWRAVLVPAGDTARRIRARIPGPGGLGRAA